MTQKRRRKDDNIESIKIMILMSKKELIKCCVIYFLEYIIPKLYITSVKLYVLSCSSTGRVFVGRGDSQITRGGL